MLALLYLLSAPTRASTSSPTSFPSSAPTASPSHYPTASPSHYPTASPSHYPTASPSLHPTMSTMMPSPYTTFPSAAPSHSPSAAPSVAPTGPGSTGAPSVAPTGTTSTGAPSVAPTGTAATEAPSVAPSTAPSFAPTRPTSAPTQIPDQLECIVGGEDLYTQNAIDITECLDPSSLQWQVIPWLQIQGKVGMTAFYAGDVVCLAGGMLNGQATNEVMCTNGTGGWTEIPGMKYSRFGAAAVHGAGWVTIAGGVASPNLSTWEYILTKEGEVNVNELMSGWNNVSAPSQVFPHVSFATSVLVNGTGCIVGGRSGITGTELSKLECTATHGDAIEVSFTPADPDNLQTPRAGATSVFINGMPCVAGGEANGTALNSIECITDIDQVAVHPLSPAQGGVLPKSIAYAANISILRSLDGLSCVAGGAQYTGPTSSMMLTTSQEVFCFNGSEWLTTSLIQYPRQKHSSFSISLPPTPAPTTYPIAPTAAPSVPLAPGQYNCIAGGGPTWCWADGTAAYVPYPLLDSPNSNPIVLTIGGLVCLAGGHNFRDGDENSVVCTNGTSPWYESKNSMSIAATGGTAIYGPKWIGVAGGNPRDSVTIIDVDYNINLAQGDIDSVFTGYWANFFDFPNTGNPLGKGFPFIVAGSSFCIHWDSTTGRSACLNTSIPFPNNWTSGPTLPAPQLYTTPLTINGAQCAVGGLDGDGNYTTAVTCGMDNGTSGWHWFEIESLPQPVWSATNLTLLGMPCVVGGYKSSGEPSGTGWCYNGSIWIDMSTHGLYGLISRTTGSDVSFTINIPIIPTILPPGDYTCVAGGPAHNGLAVGECLSKANPSAGWTQIPQFTTSRYFSTSIQLGNVVCLAGGSSTDSPPMNEVVCTNGTSSWELTNRLNQARDGAAAIYGVGWYGLLGGGGDDNIMFDSIETTTINANAQSSLQSVLGGWTQTPSPSFIFTAVGGLMNGTVCAAGGIGGVNPSLNTVMCLDDLTNPSKLNWRAGPNLTIERQAAVTLYIDGEWCVGGGADNFSDHSIECFDSVNGVWIPNSLTLPESTTGATNFSLGGMSCLVIPSVNNHVYCLNGTQWLPLPSPTIPRNQWAAFDITINPQYGSCFIGQYFEFVGSKCTSCSPGTYADLPGVTACTSCLQGKYSGAGAAMCLPCNSGTSTMGGIPMMQCQPCQPGTFSDVGAANCTRCSPGHYSAYLAMSTCTQCAVGSAQPASGQASCNDCSQGLCATTLGATSCTPCSGGTAPSCTFTTGVRQQITNGISPFFSFNANCTPSQTSYVSLTVASGARVDYPSPLPLILPCGTRFVQIAPAVFSGGKVPAGVKNISVQLVAPCGQPTGGDWEAYLTPALNATLTAIAQGNLDLGLQLGVVVFDALGRNPATNLTKRRQFRAYALKYLTQATIAQPNNPILSLLMSQAISVPNEVDVAISLDALRAYPVTVASAQAALQVIGYATTPTSPSDSAALLTRLEEFSSRAINLLGSDYNVTNTTVIVSTDNSVLVAQRNSYKDFLAGIRLTINPDDITNPVARRLLANAGSSIEMSYPKQSLVDMMNRTNITTLDCVMVATNSNLFSSMTQTQQTCELAHSLLSVTCYTPTGLTFNISNLSTSDPLKMSFPVRSYDDTLQDSVCVFFNPKTNNLSSEGCTQVAVQGSTMCQCQHATIFSVQFVPRPNIIKVGDFNTLTPSNISRHPVPVIVGCLLLGVFIAMGIWAYYRDLRESSDEIRDHKVKQRNETKVLQPSLWKEWWAINREQHLWLAVVLRRFGDPFTSKQRLATLIAAVYLSLMANGLFFQSGAKNLGASIASSIVAAAFSLPITLLFKKAAVSGLPDNYADTLYVDESSPERKTSRRLRILAYTLSFSVTALCFVLIIALGMQFDLGAYDTEVIDCFPVRVFKRDRYSKTWLLRCLLSLIWDIIFIHPLFLLGNILLRRGGKNVWNTCCHKQRHRDTVMMELPKASSMEEDEERNQPAEKEKAKVSSESANERPKED